MSDVLNYFASNKDFYTSIASFFAVLAGIFAIFRGIRELRLATKQRQLELRWKQAHEAKLCIEGIKQDQKAWEAILMLDWEGREYQSKEFGTLKISGSDVKTGLADRFGHFNEKEIMVRDRFDALFDKIEMIQTFIQSGMILKEDIDYFMGYYVSRAALHKKEIEKYCQKFHYNGSLAFFESFKEWMSHKI